MGTSFSCRRLRQRFYPRIRFDRKRWIRHRFARTRQNIYSCVFTIITVQIVCFLARTMVFLRAFCAAGDFSIFCFGRWINQSPTGRCRDTFNTHTGRGVRTCQKTKISARRRFTSCALVEGKPASAAILEI